MPRLQRGPDCVLTLTASHHKSEPPHRRRIYCSGAATILIGLLLLSGCAEQSKVVDVIRAGGELRIAIFESRSTYFESNYGPAGFEYELARGFAEHLGVKPSFVTVETESEMIELLRQNRVHLAVGLIAITNRPTEQVSYGPSYDLKRFRVISRRGRKRIRALSDLANLNGALIGSTRESAWLSERMDDATAASWRPRPRSDIDELLNAVENRRLDFLILPEREFAAARNYFPELVPSIEISEPQPTAWLFKPALDESFFGSMLDYLRDMRGSGRLAELGNHYFERFENFDYVDSRSLLRYAESRLPPFRDAFVRMGTETGIDWRLLAAVSYQESRWLEDARSPTGVRGLMMLTRATANTYGVDRLDGIESIRGGALYLASLKERLPPRIAEPDRTWLALAAYNVGLGHLEDARVLAERAGLDADAWTDVRSTLPKLQRKRWYEQTRYGFARGYQAVHFVDNTRRYFEVLRWLESTNPKTRPPEPADSTPTLISPVL